MSHRNPDFHPAMRVLHWLMMVMILAMLFIGVGMMSTAGPAYPWLLAIHRPLGMIVLLLALIRLPMRLMLGVPALPADLPPMQVLVAKASHVLLYASMIALPLIGWAMLSAGGYPVELTKAISLPRILPHNLHYYELLRSAHTAVALAFYALILGHLGAALFHGMVRRDGVLRSMTAGHGASEPVHPPAIEPASE